MDGDGGFSGRLLRPVDFEMRPICKWEVGVDGGGVDFLSVAMGGAWWVWMDGDGGFSKMFGC